jgi:hypothetical protein
VGEQDPLGIEFVFAQEAQAVGHAAGAVVVGQMPKEQAERRQTLVGSN